MLLGCGDLGARIGTTLAAAGHHVTGVRRDVSALPDGFVGVAADLAADALPDLPADLLVITLTPDRRDAAGYRRAYVDAVRRGLEAVLRTGAPSRAVLVSSTSVYGDLVGAYFLSHPANQSATSTRGRPSRRGHRGHRSSSSPRPSSTTSCRTAPSSV